MNKKEIIFHSWFFLTSDELKILLNFNMLLYSEIENK